MDGTAATRHPTPPGTPSGPSQGAAPTRTRMRVLICVENEMVRCGLNTMLVGSPTVERIDTVEDQSAAQRTLMSHRYDVLILPCADEHPTRELVEHASQLGTKVLLLLDESDDQHVGCAARNKCDGFLLVNEVTADSLRDALLRLVHGELPMPANLARELLSHVRRDGSPDRSRPPITLTPRERQVLALLVDGFSNKQIARRLGISEHGAKRHVATVLAKLNCPNRTLAVAVTLRDGLLADPTQ